MFSERVICFYICRNKIETSPSKMLGEEGGEGGGGAQSDEIIERAPLEGGSRAGVRRIPHRLGINRQILVNFLRGLK